MAKTLTWDHYRPPHVVRLGEDRTIVTASVIDGAPCMILIPVAEKDRGRDPLELVEGKPLKPDAVVVRFATPESVRKQIALLERILINPERPHED